MFNFLLYMYSYDKNLCTHKANASSLNLLWLSPCLHACRCTCVVVVASSNRCRGAYVRRRPALCFHPFTRLSSMRHQPSAGGTSCGNPVEASGSGVASACTVTVSSGELGTASRGTVACRRSICGRTGPAGGMHD